MATLIRVALVLLVLCGLSSTAVYADEKTSDSAPAPAVKPPMPMSSGIAMLGACIGAGIAAVGGGWAVSRIGMNCIESMARQPEAAGTMFGPMVVSAAMVEGGMLFALVVCIVAVLRAA